MISTGSVRKKNTHNTLLKNLLDACGAAMSFFCVGFAFAFGGDSTATGTTVVGTENFFGTGDIDLAFYFYQYTFASAAVTITAGALAERCQMAAYLCYSFFLSGFVYPVAVHQIWSVAGFLSYTNPKPLFGIGMIDFAGSSLVHFIGGTTALISTYLLGSRRGRFYDLKTGKPLEVPKAMPGHSISLQMLGAFILWFGWFGFNAGGALMLSQVQYQAEIAATCVINTFLGSSSGCLASMMMRLMLIKRSQGNFVFDVIAAMNGALCGAAAVGLLSLHLSLLDLSQLTLDVPHCLTHCTFILASFAVDYSRLCNLTTLGSHNCGPSIRSFVPFQFRLADLAQD